MGTDPESRRAHDQMVQSLRQLQSAAEKCSGQGLGATTSGPAGRPEQPFGTTANPTAGPHCTPGQQGTTGLPPSCDRIEKVDDTDDELMLDHIYSLAAPPAEDGEEAAAAYKARCAAAKADVRTKRPALLKVKSNTAGNKQ